MTWRDILQRVPLLGRIVCEHPAIRIAAFGDGATAVYRCTTCRARIDPRQLDTEYCVQSRNYKT